MQCAAYLNLQRVNRLAVLNNCVFFEIIEMPDVQSFFVSHIVRSAVMYGEL
jgi:hypothetical protein